MLTKSCECLFTPQLHIQFSGLCPCLGDVPISRAGLTALAVCQHGEHRALLLAGSTVTHMCWLCPETHEEKENCSFTGQKIPTPSTHNPHMSTIRELLVQVCGSFAESPPHIQIGDLYGNLHETDFADDKGIRRSEF